MLLTEKERIGSLCALVEQSSFLLDNVGLHKSSLRRFCIGVLPPLPFSYALVTRIQSTDLFPCTSLYIHIVGHTYTHAVHCFFTRTALALGVLGWPDSGLVSVFGCALLGVDGCFCFICVPRKRCDALH